MRLIVNAAYERAGYLGIGFFMGYTLGRLHGQHPAATTVQPVEPSRVNLVEGPSETSSDNEHVNKKSPQPSSFTHEQITTDDWVHWPTQWISF